MPHKIKILALLSSFLSTGIAMDVDKPDTLSKPGRDLTAKRKRNEVAISEHDEQPNDAKRFCPEEANTDKLKKIRPILLALTVTHAGDRASSSDENQVNSTITTSSESALLQLPPEVLGQISESLGAKEAFRLKELTGNRQLTAKMRKIPGYITLQPLFFNVSTPQNEQKFIQILQSPGTHKLHIKLKGVSLDNLTRILPHCSNVSILDLNGNQIGAAGAQAIATSPTMANLTSLNLRYNYIWAAGAKDIATMVNLTSLNLRGNYIGAAGAKDISTMANLTSLDLGGNEIGDVGVKDISTMANLTSLNLRGNYIRAAGAQAIATSPTMANLTSLNLGGNYIGAAGVKDIATMVNLTSLNLRGNYIRAAGVKDISTMANLTSLNLRGNEIGDVGVKDISTMANLTFLSLGCNQIGDAGVKDIATMTNLTSLNLGYNEIGAAGAQAIATSPTMANLTSLDLGYNWIGADVKKLIRDRYPFVIL